MISQDKPYIAIGLSFFEDVSCLERCLDSVLKDKKLRPYVKVIAIDGRFKGYPIDHDLSEDGSRELIIEYYQEEKYGGKIVLYDCPNLHERFKRQRYVDIAASMGIPWLLILDSDEYVQIPNVEKFIRELKHIAQEWEDTNSPDNPLPIQKVGNVCQVPCVDVGDAGLPGNMMNRPRLWYRPQDMHYTTKHYWFARKDEVPNPNDTSNYRLDNTAVIFNSRYKSLSINNMVIWHSHQNRTEDREMRRRYYEFERLPKLEGSAKLGIFDKEAIKK